MPHPQHLAAGLSPRATYSADSEVPRGARAAGSAWALLQHVHQQGEAGTLCRSKAQQADRISCRRKNATMGHESWQGARVQLRPSAQGPLMLPGTTSHPSADPGPLTLLPTQGDQPWLEYSKKSLNFRSTPELPVKMKSMGLPLFLPSLTSLG